MDRRNGKIRIPPIRIPRTRGDGPEIDAARDDLVRDSPHARGWTGHRLARSEAHRGFPARAGMDRAVTSLWIRALGIPRTRGDGPA